MEMDLKWTQSVLKEQVKTVDCKLAQMIAHMIQIWNDLYYSGHYVPSHKSVSSQIILVYSDKFAMLKT